MACIGRLALSALAFGTLLAASGCEVQSCKDASGQDATCAKSLKRFELDDAIAPDALPYAAGTGVTVHGIYGDIHVKEGPSGQVGVKFELFDYRAYDAEDAARDELAHHFDYTFEASDSGILVTSGRHDSTNGLGADITLYLPPEFDAALVLRNDSKGPINPGDIDAESVGQATSVDLSTKSLGACEVHAGGSVLFTRAHCDGTITATGVADDLDVASTGLSGTVSVVLSGIGESASGGSVTSEDGDVHVIFPDAASFGVQAQSSKDGQVQAPTLDTGCAADAAAETAKSYTCADGGPLYVVTAGTDSVGPSSVSLQYQP
ncbi:MAG TPA: hypothetical protein VGQ57_17005 [Polyangiaceae bacterium]|jgi:hypothetical protein|nr:hypothetical protein [Polyangiaceae bacterium]